MSTQQDDHVKTQKEGCHLEAMERPQKKTNLHIPQFQTSGLQNGKNKFLLF